jgi:hypothetical protein
MHVGVRADLGSLDVAATANRSGDDNLFKVFGSDQLFLVRHGGSLAFGVGDLFFPTGVCG